MGRVRVFIATSLDGFIAGVEDDLSWLPTTLEPSPGAITFSSFMEGVGAMLMGRRTYDMVAGFDGPWPYGAVPVSVVTHRALEGVPETVRAVSGDISDLVAAALDAAGGMDVYIDGGSVVQQCLAADLIDELIITTVPILLGGGVRLFASLPASRAFTFAPPVQYGELVQLRAFRAR